MNKYVLASRPKTLIAAISPIVIATAMAIRANVFHPWIFLFTLLTGLGVQISTNFANDLFDYLKGADNAMRKGPLRITASGLISVERMKVATGVVIFATALCGTVLIYQGGALFGFLIALALVFALGYTAGPLPIAYLGLGEVFVAIFFGPVATLCTYYLQTGKAPLEVAIAGIAPGLLSCCLLIINNIRDIDEDRAANKKTLACRWGKKFGVWEYQASLFGSLFVPLFYIKQHPIVALASLTIIPAWFLVRFVHRIKEPKDYNLALANTSKILGVYTLAFSLMWLA